MTEPDAESATPWEDAIRKALGEVTSWTSGRFVLVVEMLDEEGEPNLFTVAPNGQALWDTLGMLDFGQTLNRAKIEPGPA